LGTLALISLDQERWRMRGEGEEKENWLQSVAEIEIETEAR
jgi:hypothetical protein